MECVIITFNRKALTGKLARCGNQPGSQKRARTTCLSLTRSKRKCEIWKKSAEYREEAAEDSLSNGKTLKNRGALKIFNRASWEIISNPDGDKGSVGNGS